MSSLDANLFYKNARSENCIRETRTLFEDISNTSDVYARYQMDSEGMISLHNHMNSSTTWKSISQWDSGIQYTVSHPDGDITMYDKNRGENTSIFIKRNVYKFKGTTHGKDVDFSIFRDENYPLDFTFTSCHSSRYIWVRIESTKTFEYVSERASWVFNLSVIWEGETKDIAESSDKKYFITISMSSIDKASRDPSYTAASFMEKIMDTLFHRSGPRHVLLSR